MKKVFLSIFLFVFTFISFGQQDSIIMSVFVSPVVEVEIEEADSLIVVEEALLVGGDDAQFEYSFFVAGFDTLLVDSIELSFVSTDGDETSRGFTLQEIDSDPNINRYGDSVILPIGAYGFIDIYEYSVTLFGMNEELLSVSDFYTND